MATPPKAPTPLTIGTALEQATHALQREGVGAPRLTAEVLLAHALRCERPYLYAHDRDPITDIVRIHFGRYLNERLQGKPTQYITKQQEFYGRPFYVNRDVLIPRPETEHLVEAAVEAIRQIGARSIADVGTGSGAIAVSVALETNRPVAACDISLPALRVAARNRDQFSAQVPLFAGDLASAFRPGSLDVLLSNPPYVPGADASNMQREVRDWEPHVALFAGDSGLEVYGRLVSQASQAVRDDGLLFMELGYQSLEGVRTIVSSGPWTDIRVIHDLAGWPRVLRAMRRQLG